jgi:hypothetical protein
MKNAEYKTDQENFEEHLAIARKLTVRDIKLALNQRAFHGWAVRAYEQALMEKTHVHKFVNGICNVGTCRVKGFDL